MPAKVGEPPREPGRLPCPNFRGTRPPTPTRSAEAGANSCQPSVLQKQFHRTALRSWPFLGGPSPGLCLRREKGAPLPGQGRMYDRRSTLETCCSRGSVPTGRQLIVCLFLITGNIRAGTVPKPPLSSSPGTEHGAQGPSLRIC